ncbi:MAG TPA: TetR/AcrR family transcriptional regulator [Kofleriaceae bacterium]|nr:TetR/AcrR family transcriptional regulator [Kofleriaceae bacterium]
MRSRPRQPGKAKASRSTKPSVRQAAKPSARQVAKPSARQAAKPSARQAAKPSARQAAKPRVRLENDERRAQLLELARRVFTERAYDEVSIDDLAAAAKISKGLLYHYYPTKRDLYVASLRETAGALLAAVREATEPEAPPADRVRAGLEAYLCHVLKLDKVFVALLRGGVGSDPEVAEVLEATRRAFLDQFLARSPMAQTFAADPLVHLALRGWLGMVEATSIEWVSGPEIPRATVRDLLVDNLIATLRNARVPVP